MHVCKWCVWVTCDRTRRGQMGTAICIPFPQRSQRLRTSWGSNGSLCLPNDACYDAFMMHLTVKRCVCMYANNCYLTWLTKDCMPSLFHACGVCREPKDRANCHMNVRSHATTKGLLETRTRVISNPNMLMIMRCDEWCVQQIKMQQVKIFLVLSDALSQVSACLRDEGQEVWVYEWNHHEPRMK
jgi:hypothetical protein